MSDRGMRWSDLTLVEKLGAGQAGEVWKAMLPAKGDSHAAPFTTVAIKRYKPWVLQERGQYARIYRELRTGIKLQHPNLARTLDLIADPAGLPVLVMDFQRGTSLEQLLETARRRKRRISLNSAFRILEGLARGLSVLHAAGVVHRDVKPGNVIVSRGGRAVLMDLGVVATERLTEQTTSGEFLGTIRYASPEYLFGEVYDFTTDVFSFGAVAYELFSNRRFLEAETNWARLVAVRAAHHDSPNPEFFKLLAREHGPNAADAIRFLLGRCLGEKEQRLRDWSILLEAIAARYWVHPFTARSGRIHLGEPAVRRFGVWDGDTREWTPAQAAAQLEGSWAGRNETVLALIEDLYWRPEPRFRVPVYWSVSTNELQKQGVLRPVGGSALEPRYDVHEAALAAYRYGYLPPPKQEQHFA